MGPNPRSARDVPQIRSSVRRPEPYVRKSKVHREWSRAGHGHLLRGRTISPRMPDGELVVARRHVADFVVPSLVGDRKVLVLQHDDVAVHLRMRLAQLRVDAWRLRARG